MPACPDYEEPSSPTSGAPQGQEGQSSVRRTATLPEPPPDTGSPWSQSARAAALETERFVVRAVIARGGSSTVIRAFDKELLRDVAIKVLDQDLTDGDE